MQIYTDSPNYALHILNSKASFLRYNHDLHSEIPFYLTEKLYPKKDFFVGTSTSDHSFEHYFITKYASISQYDLLSQYAKLNNTSQANILCFAGSGENFHGFRQRKWATIPGNIHLSVLLNPGIPIQHADTAFLILAANAVTQTINSLENIESKAMIHWVNDIVIDSCKVGGVLAQTQILGQTIEKVVLGIGLNVEVNPQIEQDQFVKRTTHLNKFVTDYPYPLKDVLDKLITSLDDNYEAILNDRYLDLYHYYLEHSYVMGKRVEVYSDPRKGEIVKIAEGVVSHITENLELVLDKNREKIRRGRIKLSKST